MDAIPIGREGEPIKVANAVLFLVSDEANHITGQAMEVSAGWRM